MDEKDFVEHEVEIDDYITATLKIPKVMTAMDLKSLMVKANKLFNLSEVPIVARVVKGNHHHDWTTEEDEQIKKLSKEGKKPSEVAEIMGGVMKANMVSHRKNYMKISKKW